MSTLAARVAATYLAMEEGDPSKAPPGAGEGGGEHTALPRKGPSKDLLKKGLDELMKLLEDGDHGGFKRGLEHFTDLFKRVDANFEKKWTPQSVEASRRRANEDEADDGVTYYPVVPSPMSDEDFELMEGLLQDYVEAYGVDEAIKLVKGLAPAAPPPA